MSSYYMKPSHGGWAVYLGRPEDRPYTFCVEWCHTKRGALRAIKRRLQDDQYEPEVFTNE